MVWHHMTPWYDVTWNVTWRWWEPICHCLEHSLVSRLSGISLVSTDEQSDRKQLQRAHHAQAQVGSKMVTFHRRTSFSEMMPRGHCFNSLFSLSAHWKKKVEPKRLQGGAVFMSTGWPPFRYRFSTTFQSGTVFYQKKVDYGSTS